MQTFLPVPDFGKSARILDWRRLGKQRLEPVICIMAFSICRASSRHPAVRMWRGYEDALIDYGNKIILEWIDRGYVNNMLEHGIVLPPWFGSAVPRQPSCEFITQRTRILL